MLWIGRELLPTQVKRELYDAGNEMVALRGIGMKGLRI